MKAHHDSASGSTDLQAALHDIQAGLAHLRSGGVDASSNASQRSTNSGDSNTGRVTSFQNHSSSFHEDTNPGTYPGVNHNFDEESKKSRSNFPQEISMKSIKKFSLFCAPSVDSEFDTIRFAKKGQGSTSCTNRHCSIPSHSNKPRFEVDKGDIFIAANPDCAFSKAYINTSQLDPTLLQSWLTDQKTEEQLKETFLAASRAKRDYDSTKGTKIGLVTQKDLQNAFDFKISKVSFKTPKRLKTEALSVYANLVLPIYRPLIPEDNAKLEDSSIQDYLKTLDGRITDISKSITMLREVQVNKSVNTYDLYSSLDAQFEQLSSTIGKKPDSLDERFDAPDLWLSLASVANQINKISFQDISKDVVNLNSRLAIIERISSSFQKITKVVQDQSQQMNDLQSFTIRNIKDIISLMKADQNKTFITNNQSQNTSGLEERITHLEGTVRSYVNANGDAAVKFAGVGFRYQLEATTWLKQNFPGPHFGFLVDFHMLMEYLKDDLTVGSLLKATKKMDFTLTIQNIAVNSFNSKILSFFSKASIAENMVIFDNQSYFTQISFYCDWSAPSTGKRERLRLKLLDFQSYFKAILDSGVIPKLSPFYNKCYLAMTDTINWTEGLIKFMDDTFEIYSRTRYGCDKSWHVVTRLTPRLIEAVAKPRIGMYHMFDMSHPEYMANVIFYTTLRSLDVMSEIRAHNFRDPPIISSELTHFLAMNTDFEAVTRLKDPVHELEVNNRGLNKKLQEATKTASTAANKWDSTYKTKLDALEKRVKEVDKKVK